MGKRSHFRSYSCPELVRFKATSKHATFANDEQRLLGKTNDRHCSGYSRAFSCADGRWQAAFHVPGSQAKQKRLLKNLKQEMLKDKAAVATHHVTLSIYQNTIYFYLNRL